jgi:hypothetical protein
MVFSKAFVVVKVFFSSLLFYSTVIPVAHAASSTLNGGLEGYLPVNRQKFGEVSQSENRESNSFRAIVNRFKCKFLNDTERLNFSKGNREEPNETIRVDSNVRVELFEKMQQKDSEATPSIDPLCAASEGRFALFPIKYPQLWNMYKQQVIQ